MRNLPTSAGLVFIAALLVAGCLASGCHRPAVEPPAADDSAVWVEENLEHEGTTIALGYRKEQADDRAWLEPLARITRDGKPVADAMVFPSLVAVDGRQVQAADVATVYETSEEPGTALYGRAKLPLPENASQCTVRFRLVLPDSEQEWTRDVGIAF